MRKPNRCKCLGFIGGFRTGLNVGGAARYAMVRWSMVTDAEGNVGDALHLPNKASKGKKGA